MKKIVLLLTIGILMMGLLMGCGKSPNSSPVIPDQTPIESEDTLHKIVNLLGQDDSKVVETFGEGTAHYIEGTKQILSREFSISLFGESLTAIVNYDDNMLMVASFISLPEKEIEIYQKEMELVLGSHDTTEEDVNQEEGNGKMSYIWNTEKASIILKQVYGAITIEMMPLLEQDVL